MDRPYFIITSSRGGGKNWVEERFLNGGHEYSAPVFDEWNHKKWLNHSEWLARQREQHRQRENLLKRMGDL